MRIIIAGGTGLIGKALARSLVDDKHKAIVLSRKPDRVKGLPSIVHIEAWDGRTAAGWGKLADGADAIVNLAGESIGGTRFLPPRWTSELKQRIFESRQNAAQAVIEAVRAAKKSRACSSRLRPSAITARIPMSP